MLNLIMDLKLELSPSFYCLCAGQESGIVSRYPEVPTAVNHRPWTPHGAVRWLTGTNTQVIHKCFIHFGMYLATLLAQNKICLSSFQQVQ